MPGRSCMGAFLRGPTGNNTQILSLNRNIPDFSRELRLISHLYCYNRERYISRGII
jgi:hypothetical protein